LSTLHSQKIIKYDIIFYDNQDIKGLGDYFVDLSDYIDEDQINLYDQDILSILCKTNNKLIGLVCFNYINTYIYIYIPIYVVR